MNKFLALTEMTYIRRIHCTVAGHCNAEAHGHEAVHGNEPFHC